MTHITFHQGRIKEKQTEGNGTVSVLSLQRQVVQNAGNLAMTFSNHLRNVSVGMMMPTAANVSPRQTAVVMIA